MTGPETAWSRIGERGAGLDNLVFGRMFEDWTIEARLFPPASRVFAIASAGCTSLGLAALGHDVTAVDINGAQVELLRRRAAGEPTREGKVDRMLARGRRALGLLGWTDQTVRAFADLDDPIAQRDFWRTHLDTRRWRATLGILLHPALLRFFYPAPLVQLLPRGFATLVRTRMERGFSIHPNRTNPYARGLLLGSWPLDPPATQAGSITAVEADAVEYLEACAPHSFTALTLSNILDGVGGAYGSRLDAAVARAAAPGAVIVMRSFAEPQTPDEDDWARRDRALLWGRIRVERR